MMPLCTTATRPVQSVCGWAFSSLGRPWVAHLVCPMPTVPSGGDTGSPGLAFYNEMLWVTYHSSHEGRAMIYLAQVKLSPPGDGKKPTDTDTVTVNFPGTLTQPAAPILPFRSGLEREDAELLAPHPAVNAGPEALLELPLLLIELLLPLTLKWAREMGVPLLQAIDLTQNYHLSFWDAMVIQSAAHFGCKRLLSEDLNAGQVYGNVRVVNPFAA